MVQDSSYDRVQQSIQDFQPPPSYDVPPNYGSNQPPGYDLPPPIYSDPPPVFSNNVPPAYDVPPPFDTPPPFYNEPPRSLNDAPPSYNQSYDFAKSKDVDLGPNPTFADVPPPVDYQPPQYHDREHVPTTVIYENQAMSEPALIFHIVSIVCCLLAVIFTPIIEVIPMVWICFVMGELPKYKAHPLHICDLIITGIVCLVYLFFILIIAVFTYGIGLILLIFLIPFIVVLIGLLAKS